MTTLIVKAILDAHMLDVEVIADPATAVVALDPIRSRILAELGEPASAAIVAQRLDLPRQKVNYHLRSLEKHGLARVAEQRSWGGLTERLLVATSRSYVVSPGALGRIATDPERSKDRLSASYLISLASRVVRELGDLVRRAARTEKRLATLSIDANIRFQSPEDRAAFSHELTAAVTQLVSRFHHPSSLEGRDHRLIIGAYPTAQTTPPPSVGGSHDDS